MRYAGIILLVFAASVKAVKELVGPAVVAVTLVSAAAPTIKSLALLVTAAGVIGFVVTPALVGGATSTALEGATPENSLTFTPPLPVPL